MKIMSIIDALPQEDHVLKIVFSDGLVKFVDLKPFIKNGVSSALKDLIYFRNVKVQDGFISWENGFDFCPNFLYNYTPQS